MADGFFDIHVFAQIDAADCGRRVMVIGDGQILSDGTLDELRASVTRERWLTVDIAENASRDLYSLCDPEHEWSKALRQISQAVLAVE